MPIWIEYDPEYLKEQRARATSGEYSEEDVEAEEGQFVTGAPGERVITIGKRTDGETMAHELGHVVSGHKFPAPDNPRGIAIREVQAWLWAKRKRGRLTTNIVRRVAVNLILAFPDMTMSELVTTIREAYSNLGEEPPSEDYIQKVIEKEYGFE